MGRGGKASELPSQGPEVSLAEDIPNFSEFLGDSFSPAAFANRALQTSATSAQAQITQLEDSVRKVKEKLSSEVIRRQDDFLEKASSMRSAEESVQRISSSADALAASLNRVADEILGPYRSIQIKTLQLKNIQASTEVLRQILQSVKLTQRLKTLMGSGSASGALSVLDLGKAAKLLTEVSAVNEFPGLSAIDLVRAEASFLESVRVMVNSQAQDYLEKGMEATSQVEVGAALQVYFNLNSLPQAVHHLVDGHVSLLAKQLSSTLDPKRLAGEASVSSNARSTVASTRVQEVFWQRMADLLSGIHKSSVAVWHLQRVLMKKRDPLTHVLFLDTFVAVSGKPPLQVFWPTVCRKLKAGLEGAISPGKGPLMRETMIHNFPHFASLVDSFFKKLYQETSVKGVEAAANKEVEVLFGEALSGCQNLYLGAVFSRVSDAITAAFPGGNRALPTSAELQKCIARIHEELKNVGESAELAATTTAVVGKALRVLAEKAEFMALAGSEVRNVSGVCTTQQMRKIMLCNHLQEVSRSVAAFLPKLPPAASQNLRDPIETLEAGVLEAVMPLIRAIVDRGESIILKMHQVDYNLEEDSFVTRASDYIQELTKHIIHCRVEFLSKLSPPANPQNSGSVGAALVQRLASRLVVFLVRHAAMLRPVSKSGRAQLVKDVAEFEDAVSTNLWPLDRLLRPSRVLHAFQKLLVLETVDIPKNTQIKDLPTVFLLLHLFSRTPEALPSPHVKSGLTPQQFSLWLDEHSGSDAVKFVQSSLDSSRPPAGESEELNQSFELITDACKAYYDQGSK